MKQIWKALDNLSPSNIKLSQLPRKPDGLHNLSFNEYGQLVKRAGYSTYGASIGDSHKIVGMHRFYRQDNSVKEFLVAWNTGIYVKSDTSLYGATLIKSSLTADSDTHFVDFLNHYYFVNGVDGVFKGTLTDEVAGTRTSDTIFTRTAGTWDIDALIGQYAFSYVDTAPTVGKWTVIADNAAGTVTITGTLYAGANRIKISTIRTMGITAPTVKCAGTAAGTSGYLGAGDYKYIYTWVDEDGYESNGAPISDAITATALATISLTGVANSTDPKIVSKNIYRTSVGGAIYYYEGAIDNNTTTTFSSTIADSSLGSVLATNHTAPETTSHLICKRREKLYLAYNNYLYPSHISDVEYFPPLWRLRTGNSQKIMGLLEQLTALPAATEDSIERLVGTDEDNFEFINSYSTEGCVALRSYVNCDNLIVYLGFNGINYFDGVTSGIFSEAVNKYIRENINGAYRHLSCATYWDNKYMLCYPKGANTVPSETIWIDLKNKTYGVYDFAFSCFSVWNRGTDGLQLKGGSNTIGQVYSIFSGLDDGGEAITAYDSIEPLDMGIPEVYKQWYSIFIKIKTTDGTALAMFYTLDNNDETSSVIISRDDIAFVDGGAGEEDTITTTAGDFVAAGFVAGDVIVVTGDSENNGNYTIVSVVAKTINVATASLTGEIKGDDVVIIKAKVLTANTTKWYRVGLGSGGKRARTFKPRPYISDKYYFEIHDYMVCYEIEPFAEEKE